MSDLFDKLRPVTSALGVHGTAEPAPFRTVIEAVHSPVEVTIAGRRTLLFGSNNYLGLTHAPAVRDDARDAAAAWGAGTTGSRVANGTLSLHVSLEDDLARTLGKRRAVVFTTGHQANLALLSLAGPGDTVLLDAESHASIFDGAKLSGATTIVFRHNSASDLDKKLARLPAGETNRLVVVEGLYSTSGTRAPLAELVDIVRRRGGYLAVDEAHSFGVLGERGRGRAEECGVLDAVDFVVGTFSKALGTVGGFVASNHEALSLLPYTARSYLFTASSSAPTVAAARAALGLMYAEPERRTKLRAAARRWRSGLAELGLSDGREGDRDHDVPIVPIVLGDAARAVGLWRDLLERGLYVNLVLPPGCPASRAGLRTSVSAAHDESVVDRALRIVKEALR